MAHVLNMIDDAVAISTTIHSMSYKVVATTLGSHLVFLAQDMFLNVPLVVNWQTSTQNHDFDVHENLHCANRKRCQYHYVLGQQGLKKVHNPTELGVRTEALTQWIVFMSMVILLSY